MRPPPFWNPDGPRTSGAVTRALLSPLGWAYAAAGAWRIARTAPAPAPAPVICVGNLTLGGTGKTPVTLAVMDAARALGLTPAALTRGWGGRLAGPVQVDPALHGAREAGDEPLLLARTGLTVLDRKRVEGARLAADLGADLIVMDDGHQNPRLEKSLSLVVVDGETGWGPGQIFPAGPLREPVSAGLARADAVIVMGPDEDYQPDLARLGLDALERPVLRAWLAPEAAPPEGPLVAFAGIGRPQKFYDALVRWGGQLVETASFPDHHAFSRGDLNRLSDLAAAHDASLITTEKDWVRLPGDVRSAIAAWPVRARFAEPARLTALVEQAVDAWRARR
ncbi:tetraacyldisaccharide 4'-kinase [Alkalicaulis satelles]|uniref:Tetraacyldisaccharide 4'-kinase n=1 Tax=Alkalicaulis satelles TaxID=2609175 RepID=A0A5M6ZFK5_9PROT|nr:tetraacyldisaccharide 4'-kinase [Alkalicaulis satelles]KAA5803533.1 tetraacyldisaccharide 4'-kinase [Alkalicaulis satelles]